MKKIIITTIALVLGVSAFAKDINQLMAEMPKGYTTSAEQKLRMAYTEANKDDFIRELKAYAKSDVAKKLSRSLSEDESNLRRTLSCAYALYGVNLGIPEIVGLRFSPIRYFDAYGLDGYDKVKSAGWTLDGEKLEAGEIIALAFRAKDTEYILNCDVSKWGVSRLETYAKDVRQILIYSDDQNKAKAFCRQYLGAMLYRGISDTSDAFRTLKAVEDYLNRGILFK